MKILMRLHKTLTKMKKRLELTKKELNRLWEWEQFIPHNKYKTLDRRLLIKIRNKLNEVNQK